MNQKFFSEQISKKDNLFSLEHLDTEYEDLKSANAKQSASPLLENNDQPCSDCATRDSIERSQQNALQAAPMNVSSVFDEEKLSEFKKLCRNKKGREFQSGGNLNKLVMPGDSRNTSDKSSASDIRNASSKTAESEIINDSYKAPVSGFRNASSKIPVCGVRNATFKSPASDIRNTSFKTSPSGLRSASFKTPVSDQRDNSFKSSATDTVKQSPRTGSDKIRRFLEFSAKREVSFEGSGDNSVPMTTLDTDTSEKSIGSFMANVPPIAEIEVVKGHPTEVHVSVDQPSIPLSGDLVKQVFPYHIVINENFRIIQIGNSLARLIENEFLIGKCVSDVLTITGPIPSFGKRWDWRILDKMKEKTIFFEALCSNSSFQKPKIKGSMIELKKAPNRQVLLALSPNVKNLSELETMNLSMTDLPLHSCQRDAVLLGEHSKSEVKLTNHLDHLHRDLIDSMEKQIEDRTNELGTANTNLELANAQLAVQSAKQLEHFACMSHEIRTPLNCIVGMSSLLLEESEGPSMDPMQADSIRMINTSGELLRAVVDDVLDYAKLESGSFEVDMKSTKLQDTLDSVLYSISQKMQDKNVRLRTHFTPTVPEYIETDSRRLQQVLFNLLGNAGKFSKTNSVIDLSVSLIKASSQSYSNESSEIQDLIRFSVRDYGKGIEKKDFETIFQPFSQAR
jgi:signal transduction histidine kinase